jgi:hypothetical protein
VCLLDLSCALLRVAVVASGAGTVGAMRLLDGDWGISASALINLGQFDILDPH